MVYQTDFERQYIAALATQAANEILESEPDEQGQRILTRVWVIANNAQNKVVLTKEAWATIFSDSTMLTLIETELNRRFEGMPTELMALIRERLNLSEVQPSITHRMIVDKIAALYESAPVELPWF